MDKRSSKNLEPADAGRACAKPRREAYVRLCSKHSRRVEGAEAGAAVLVMAEPT